MLSGVLSISAIPSSSTLRLREQSRVPSLHSTFTEHQRYYEPLGLPSGTTPFRIPLIGGAFARRGQPVRASPVPCRAFAACSPPYPGGVLHPSGSPDAVCCLRRDMSGSASPSLSGCHLTRLQGSLDVGPAALLPSHSPYSELMALDAPLGRGDLAPRLEPATRRTGAYRGGTLTRKSIN